MRARASDLRLTLGVILVVWIAISGRAVVTGDYEGLEIITPVVLGAIGPLFALLMIQYDDHDDHRNGKPNGNGSAA